MKGAIINLNLGRDAPRIFKAVVEATCFGAKAIVERFNEEEIPVKGLIGLGGVARKSPYIMQMMADIMQMPIRIHKSEQTCAPALQCLLQQQPVFIIKWKMQWQQWGKVLIQNIILTKKN